MPQAKTLSLGSASDLVVKCAWAPGMISADEPCLPRTRLAITFRALFALRKIAREVREPAFADPIERLEQIHSFRLAAEEDGLRLSVTYDFGWESYMRALHDKAGPFLDLLCCHCHGYGLARDTPLEDWQRWIEVNQTQSDYFYSATPLTVGDLAALTQGERLQRDEVDIAKADRSLAAFCSTSPEGLAEAKRLRAKDEAASQAIRVITAMHRLTRYWTADVVGSAIPGDAITLIRATRALIENSFVAPNTFDSRTESMFRSELAWYRQSIPDASRPTRSPGHDPADIQRGVLSGFDEPGAPITHGAAVFLAITDPAQARASLAKLPLASETREAPTDGVFRNLAFTHAGLERLRVNAATLDAAPLAFREGAAARAGAVGDVRSFHPATWRHLRRNWEPERSWEIDLARVDALVQLRIAKPGTPIALDAPNHPLRAEIEWIGQLAGLEMLAVEALAPAKEPGSDVDHLGFRDGLSQPTLLDEKTRPWSDTVEEGALLVGRGARTRDSFWLDGSFLAVRRMTVDRAAFDKVLAADAKPGLNDPELLAAKLLGRHRDGTRLGAGRTGNNFVFDGDETGAVCPLDSHIRRANPRREDTPRIMRRGMSFGTPAGKGQTDDTERGTFFMAYCADLAEQYERILSWVNGGNSTRTGSYLADPLTGVPDSVGRTYRFLHDGAVQRLALPSLGKGPVGLSWSLYLFAPSLPAIRALGTQAPASPQLPNDLIGRGRRIIDRLRETEADEQAWRALLNEPHARDKGDAQAVWAAIRADKGILDTPAGYLVGSYELVLEVLRDDGRRFSNRGTGERIEATIGQFHLGLDPYTPEYRRLSEPANASLRSVSEEQAFGEARAATKTQVNRILTATSVDQPEIAIDLLTNLIEPVLAALATTWFGIPDGTHVETGSHDWTVPLARAPRYPGDFWNPSRYTFNPFRSAETERMARVDGPKTVAAVTELIQSRSRRALDAPVTKRMAAAVEAYPDDPALARALVGCLVGGVPTVAGNAVRLLVKEMASGELDRQQWPWLYASGPEPSFHAARTKFAPMMEGLLARAPVPEVLWRIVASDGVHLGGESLNKGATLIFSLESAGLDRLGRGITDNYIPYGMAPPEEEPTAHGCPGRGMANGIILGLLVGLVESARFRSGAAPGIAQFRRFA